MGPPTRSSCPPRADRTGTPTAEQTGHECRTWTISKRQPCNCAPANWPVWVRSAWGAVVVLVMVRLHFQLYKGVQYVQVELCCSAPRESQGLYRNTSGTMNYQSSERSLGQAECARQGEKCIVIFSHLHSSLVHISVWKLGDFWYVLALIRVKTLSRPMPLLHFLLPS